jgi:hypothetical protein
LPVILQHEIDPASSVLLAGCLTVGSLHSHLNNHRRLWMFFNMRHGK